MPLYEYKCRKCGKGFEEIRKFSDPPLTVHEHCGGELQKLLSPPAIQFKGTGWYVTDYAKKSEGSQDNKQGGDQKKTEKTAKDAKTAKTKTASSDTKSASTSAKT